MIAASLGRTQGSAMMGSTSYLATHDRPRTPADLQPHDCIRVRLPNGALYSWHFEKDRQTA